MIIRIIVIALLILSLNQVIYADTNNDDYIGSVNYYNNTYVELEQQRKKKEALKILEEWAQKYPDDPTVYGYWGFQLLEEGKNEESLPKFNKATQLAPNYETAFLGWGEALYSLGKYQEAKEKVEHSIKLLPGLDTKYYLLGKIQYELKEYDEALKNFEYAINNQSWPIDDYSEKIQKDSKNYIELIKSKKKSATP